ncbi:MAG: PLP-dependent transferase [Candidatus Dormibacteraeota bacterium]|nr:PLP-dependent transferase [Candidatus Dormibacteraeota bacterium]
MPSPVLTAVQTFSDLQSLDVAIESRDAYRRYGSESARLLEEAMIDLETPPGGAALVARATASGQAALMLALTLLAAPRRRRVVVVRPCYGGTDALIAGPMSNLGLQLTTVDVAPGDGRDHGDAVRAALDADVCAVVTEVITNPLMTVIDVPAVIAAAHEAGAAAMVDSTFTTPFLWQPFAHGADVVFHSLTKHLSGHSDVLGGVLLVSTAHEASDWVDGFSRLTGAVLAPFDAWLALRGMRTASLRLERASCNAAALADWLCKDARVHTVHYPGGHGEREQQLVQRMLPEGRGPMLSLELEGGRDAADGFVRRLEGIRLAPSLGDVATTVSHPALTSHRSLSREQREALGIGDGLVRISTGIEAIEDLKAEIDAALG